VQKRIAELKSHIPLGGLREATVRALIYVGLGRGSVDERGFETVRRLRGKYGDIPLSEFKTLVRDQYFMLLIDKDASLAAIPSMLPSDTTPWTSSSSGPEPPWRSRIMAPLVRISRCWKPGKWPDDFGRLH
jgi:hypothetical protein